MLRVFFLIAQPPRLGKAGNTAGHGFAKYVIAMFDHAFFI
jgi:hypothetical protein